MKSNRLPAFCLLNLCVIVFFLTNCFPARTQVKPVVVEILENKGRSVNAGLPVSCAKPLKEILKSAPDACPGTIILKFNKEATSEIVGNSVNAAADVGFSKILIGCAGFSNFALYDIKLLEKYYTPLQNSSAKKTAIVDGLRIKKVSVYIQKKIFYMGHSISVSSLRNKLAADAKLCDILCVEFVLARNLKISDWWVNIPCHEQSGNVLVWISSVPTESDERD